MFDIDSEYDLWLQEQADLLRQNRFEELDLKNLIEELETLVRGEKSAVESLTINILTHLMYCEFWDKQQRAKRHWQAEITNFRYQLENKLSTNLKNHLVNNWDNLLKKAIKLANIKTGLKITAEYTLEQVLDQDFLP
ncbi:hypothetical protein STA3757_20910 [Stanieria sp. NIES-3757]|nr:hypothetical protein STA3757_20910 [Stanieria sp. NIES-3757]